MMDDHYKELDLILSHAWEGWHHFESDLVNQPGYSKEQEQLYKDAFVAGVISCHTVLMTRLYERAKEHQKN